VALVAVRVTSKLPALGWALFEECETCGARPGAVCVFVTSGRPRKLPCPGRGSRQPPYVPSNPNPTRLARIVLQVMNREGYQPRDLGILAGQSRQWTYRVINEQDRKMTQRQADHLLSAMGYTLQYRAVPKHEAEGGSPPETPAG
jgi:hypothetical protein